MSRYTKEQQARHDAALAVHTKAVALRNCGPRKPRLLRRFPSAESFACACAAGIASALTEFDYAEADVRLRLAAAKSAQLTPPRVAPSPPREPANFDRSDESTADRIRRQRTERLGFGG